MTNSRFPLYLTRTNAPLNSIVSNWVDALPGARIPIPRLEVLNNAVIAMLNAGIIQNLGLLYWGWTPGLTNTAVDFINPDIVYTINNPGGNALINNPYSGTKGNGTSGYYNCNIIPSAIPGVGLDTNSLWMYSQSDLGPVSPSLKTRECGASVDGFEWGWSEHTGSHAQFYAFATGGGLVSSAYGGGFKGFSRTSSGGGITCLDGAVMPWNGTVGGFPTGDFCLFRGGTSSTEYSQNSLFAVGAGGELTSAQWVVLNQIVLNMVLALGSYVTPPVPPIITPPNAFTNISYSSVTPSNWISSSGVIVVEGNPPADNSTPLQIASFIVSAGGSGYSTTPSVIITPSGAGLGAAATATVSAGVVTAITVTNAGTDYFPPPTVSFTGGGGSGATAVAVLTANTYYAQFPLTVALGQNRGTALTSTQTIVRPAELMWSDRCTSSGFAQNVNEIFPAIIQPSTGLICAPQFSSPTQAMYATACKLAWSLGWIPFNEPRDPNGNGWGDYAALAGFDTTGLSVIAAYPATGVGAVTVTAGGTGYATAPSVVFGGDGSGAAATATVSAGVVTAITVTNAGTGYTPGPVITITDSTGPGTGATATVTISGGSVTGFNITNAGAEYVTPVVTITGGGGSGATATATQTSGAITAMAVSAGGSGYPVPLTVSFTGGGGSGATATAYTASQVLTTDVNAFICPGILHRAYAVANANTVFNTPPYGTANGIVCLNTTILGLGRICDTTNPWGIAFDFEMDDSRGSTLILMTRNLYASMVAACVVGGVQMKCLFSMDPIVGGSGEYMDITPSNGYLFCLSSTETQSGPTSPGYTNIVAGGNPSGGMLAYLNAQYNIYAGPGGTTPINGANFLMQMIVGVPAITPDNALIARDFAIANGFSGVIIIGSFASPGGTGIGVNASGYNLAVEALLDISATY